MSFYNLSTKLIDSKANETTTMSSISYLPCQVGTVKAMLKKLKKEKPDWKLEILEGEKSNELTIEDRVKFSVAKEHWSEFLDIFKGSISDKMLNLGSINEDELDEKRINEILDKDLADLRIELKASLVKLLNGEEFIAVDKSINSWKVIFGVGSYRTQRVAIPQENKNRGIQQIFGKLIRAYGKDKGNLEMIIEHIQDRRPLNSFDVFKGFDYIYGTRLQSNYSDVILILESTVDFIYDVTQSIYISDQELLEEIEDRFSGQLKRSKNVIYPSGGRFKPEFFNSLREMIDELETSDEHSENI
jgi:hypothetical protein